MWMFAQKNASYESIASKSMFARIMGAKFAGSTASRRGGVYGVPVSTGRGDVGVPGQVVHGNTANPVGNAQRDGQVRDMKTDMGNRDPSKRLESRKKQKLR